MLSQIMAIFAPCMPHRWRMCWLPSTTNIYAHSMLLLFSVFFNPFSLFFSPRSLCAGFVRRTQAKLETKALKAKRPGFTDERYHETSYYIENGKLLKTFRTSRTEKKRLVLSACWPSIVCYMGRSINSFITLHLFRRNIVYSLAA